jgi:hypothetical protein
MFLDIIRFVVIITLNKTSTKKQYSNSNKYKKLFERRILYMSKHKKHKRPVNTNNSTNNMNENIDESLESYDTSNNSDDENDVDDIEDIQDENTDLISEIENEHIIDNRIEDSIEDSNNEPVLEPENNVDSIESIQPKIENVTNTNSIFYKVGLNFINGKCVNQITSTTDLSLAKEVCINYRNSYKKTCYVFDNDGRVIYTAEYTIPKDNCFRVGTDWRNGVCINQKVSCPCIDEAIESANTNTKLYGVVYNVYDPSGKIVFTAKKKLTLLSLKKRGNKDVSWYT